MRCETIQNILFEALSAITQESEQASKEITESMEKLTSTTTDQVLYIEKIVEKSKFLEGTFLGMPTVILDL